MKSFIVLSVLFSQSVFAQDLLFFSGPGSFHGQSISAQGIISVTNTIRNGGSVPANQAFQVSWFMFPLPLSGACVTGTPDENTDFRLGTSTQSFLGAGAATPISSPNQFLGNIVNAANEHLANNSDYCVWTKVDALGEYALTDPDLNNNVFLFDEPYRYDGNLFYPNLISILCSATNWPYQYNANDARISFCTKNLSNIFAPTTTVSGLYLVPKPVNQNCNFIDPVTVDLDEAYFVSSNTIPANISSTWVYNTTTKTYSQLRALQNQNGVNILSGVDYCWMSVADILNQIQKSSKLDNRQIHDTPMLLPNPPVVSGMDEAQDQSSLLVFPTVTQNIVTVQIKGEALSGIEYIIYDYSGRILLQNTLNQSSEVIDVSTFASGTYIIAIQQNGRYRGQSKFIKH